MTRRPAGEGNLHPCTDEAGSSSGMPGVARGAIVPGPASLMI